MLHSKSTTGTAFWRSLSLGGLSVAHQGTRVLSCGERAVGSSMSKVRGPLSTPARAWGAPECKLKERARGRSGGGGARSKAVRQAC